MIERASSLALPDPDAALNTLRASLITSRLTLEGRGVVEGDVLAPGEGPEVVFQGSAFQKRVKRLTMPEGGTLADAVAMTGIGARLRRQLGVYVGDTRVPVEMWDKVRPKAGAQIFVRLELAGDGAKDVLRSVLMIALIVVSAFLAPYLTPILTGIGIPASIAGSLAFAVVLTAGQALINHLIPPPKASNQFGFDQQPGNPYAQITGLRNQMVPYGPIPRVLGERRLYPMLAARPYTEMVGRDQYLRMLLLVGYGPLDISDIKIGNTPITAFAGAEYEIREGWETDTDVTLFTRTIAEESLSILLLAPYDNIRTTDSDTTEASIDVTFPSGLTTYNSTDGSKTARTVQFTVQYRLSGSGGAWTNVTWINGSSANGTGTSGQINATDQSSEATVRSGRFRFPSAGAWDIKFNRITGAGTSFDVDAAYWTVLRSIKADTPVNMPGLALLAVRLKATQQLNGVPDTISCLAKSYLQVYDPGTESWDWQISRNPAWEYTDLLKRRGLTTMIEDDKLILPAFVDWANACDEEAPNAVEPRWQCDLVVEQSSQFTALQTVAAHGRAQFAIVDGKYSIVRDVEQASPVQHISPRNSRGYRGFKAYVDIPHAFRVGFINPDKEDAIDERLVFRDGYAEVAAGSDVAATKYEAIELPGCRSSTQAWREGRYHFAQLLLRPEEHSVTMDVENIRCTKGDLVQFAHHAVSIGLASGRIAGRTTGGAYVTHFDLDTGVDMSSGGSYGLRIRHADGTSSVHPLASAVGIGITTVELATPTPTVSAAETGDLFFFGEVDLESAPMIVKSIEHSGQLTARITMLDAQDGVYTADTDTIPDFNSYITNPRPIWQKEPDPPTITLRSDETALLRTRAGVLIERLLVELTPPGPIQAIVREWEVELRPTGSDGDWRQIARGPIQNTIAATTKVFAGEIYDVRARYISQHGVASDWTEVDAHTIIGKTTAPDPPSGFSVTGTLDGVNVAFTLSPSLDVKGYEIRVGGANWAAATKLGTIAGPKGFFTYALAGATTFRIKALDAVGLYSTEVTGSASANTAGALATRNATTYYQTTAPSSPISGDLWIDSDDPLARTYRYNGTGYDVIADKSNRMGFAYVASTNMEISDQGATKLSGSSAFDSQIYSVFGFVGGAHASAAAAATNKRVRFGLNADPSTDAAEAGLDYSWQLHEDGTCKIYESNTLQASVGNYATGDSFVVSFDGFTVTYYQNGVPVRQIDATITARLYFDSSFYSVGGQLDTVSFAKGAFPLQSKLDFAARFTNTMALGRDSVLKASGSNAYDCSLYSTRGHKLGVHCSASPGSTSTLAAFGIDTAQNVTDSTNLDFGWQFYVFGGIWAAPVVAGVVIGSAAQGSYAASDVFSLSYDGKTVRYYANGVLVYSTPNTSTSAYYFNAMIYTVGDRLDNIEFGKGVLQVVNIPGPGQIAVNEWANLVTDPHFTDYNSTQGASASGGFWSLYATGAQALACTIDTSTNVTTQLNAPRGLKADVSTAGNASSKVFDAQVTDDYVAIVEPGMWYRARLATRHTSGVTGRPTIKFDWLDQAKALISTDTIAGTDYRTSAAGSAANETLNNIKQAPATARFLRMRIRIESSGTLNNAGQIYVALPVLQKYQYAGGWAAVSGLGGAISTATPLSAADVGATDTISIASFTVKVPDANGVLKSVTYNSGSITGRSFSTVYHVWALDPGQDGGTVTYVSDTNTQTYGADVNYFYVGAITTPANGAGGTTGGGITGSTVGCVAADAFVDQCRRAAEITIGSVIDLLNYDGKGWGPGLVDGAEHSPQPCVRLTTSSGVQLTCSVSTPITQPPEPDGAERTVLALNAYGALVAVIDDVDGFRWEEITGHEFVGEHVVAHIHCGGGTYAAGDAPDRRMFTHNAFKP